MKFTFLFVDKTRSKLWQAAEAEYLNRLGHFVKYEIKIIPPVKNKNPEECLRLESQKIITSASRSDSYLVVLEKSGVNISSTELAHRLDSWQMQGQNITFIIGGAFGLSKELRAKASFVWSLSNLTFTHEMIRTLIFEQLYRAFTINKNIPYHY